MLAALRFLIDRRPIALWLALGLPGVGVVAEQAQAQEFSALVVSRDAVGVALGADSKLFVANRKVRIEIPNGSGDRFFLVDGNAGTALLVRPAQRIFMDAKQSTRLTRLFVPVDPNNPCPQWQSAAENAGLPGASGDWRCERIGSSIVDGRSTIEYSVVSPDQEPSHRWIDRDLGFPVKLEAPDGATIALENIRLEAQPASLFAVPAGYQRFDPRLLIERIQHSDVWVEPPKP